MTMILWNVFSGSRISRTSSRGGTETEAKATVSSALRLTTIAWKFFLHCCDFPLISFASKELIKGKSSTDSSSPFYEYSRTSPPVRAISMETRGQLNVQEPRIACDLWSRSISIDHGVSWPGQFSPDLWACCVQFSSREYSAERRLNCNLPSRVLINASVGD